MGKSTIQAKFINYIIEEKYLYDTYYNAHYIKYANGEAEYWAHCSNSIGINTSTWTSPIAYMDSISFDNIWSGVFNAVPHYVLCTSNNSQLIGVYPYAWTETGISQIRFLTVGTKTGIGYNFTIYARGTWK